MEQKKAYSGIDIFRIIAAILVIANHTSPLAQISGTADFILTRVVARLAVPFFFMTSGFFLIRTMNKSNERLWAFLKKSAIIYLAAMTICLPLNFISGYFRDPALVGNLIRDIFLNGTLYHLWYLPASILGAFIAWFLVKKLGMRAAIVSSTVLYLLGVLGSAYQVLVFKIPIIGDLLKSLLLAIETTRNGLFFAPVFFVLGGYLYSIKDKIKKPSISLLAFIASFALMCAEGLILRSQGFLLTTGVPNDSMYFMLVPTAFFFFAFLMSFRGKRFNTVRDCSLIVYIIHPIVIVALRFISKPLGLFDLVIKNQLVLFTLVSVISVVASIILVKLYKLIPKKGTKQPYERAWIELDLEALKHDIRELRRIMPEGCSLMAVLKDRAYGHSVFETACVLSEMGVNAYAVATVNEGIQLRYFGIKGTILILGYTDPSRAKDLVRYKLCQTVFDLDYAKELNSQKKKVTVHIAIDSGMHRIGIDHNDIQSISEVYKLPYLYVDGIFSHLCVSDSDIDDDIRYTNFQIDNFNRVIDKIEAMGNKVNVKHLQNSYGLINYPSVKCDYARIGIALYGVDSEEGINKNTDIDLQPVLSLRTKIIQIRTLPAGETVGYGRAFTTGRESRIAVIPIGYADGLPRSLSGEKANVIVCSKKVPIIGRICMDQCMIDVTDVPEAKVGSIATVIGTDGDTTITAQEVAKQADTITNELLSRLGRRFTVITK